MIPAMTPTDSELQAPLLLIAMPQIVDPFFHRSVVLLVHHDGEGSLGFIINRPTAISVAEILQGMEIDWRGEGALVAHFGGPVQPQLGTVLFSPTGGNGDEAAGAAEVCPGVALTQHVGTLSHLAAAPAASACCSATRGLGPGSSSGDPAATGSPLRRGGSSSPARPSRCGGRRSESVGVDRRFLPGARTPARAQLSAAPSSPRRARRRRSLVRFRQLLAGRTRRKATPRRALATAGDRRLRAHRAGQGVDPRGFPFYTNLRSRKTREAGGEPARRLCFHWPAIAQQVREPGRAAPGRQADAYAATRPRDSQLGAWASRQSAPLPRVRRSRARSRWRALRRPSARPPFWKRLPAGAGVIEVLERPRLRLHDRLLFALRDGRWEQGASIVTRLRDSVILGRRGWSCAAKCCSSHRARALAAPKGARRAGRAPSRRRCAGARDRRARRVVAPLPSIDYTYGSTADCASKQSTSICDASRCERDSDARGGGRTLVRLGGLLGSFENRRAVVRAARGGTRGYHAGAEGHERGAQRSSMCDGGWRWSPAPAPASAPPPRGRSPGTAELVLGARRVERGCVAQALGGRALPHVTDRASVRLRRRRAARRRARSPAPARRSAPIHRRSTRGAVGEMYATSMLGTLRTVRPSCQAGAERRRRRRRHRHDRRLRDLSAAPLHRLQARPAPSSAPCGSSCSASRSASPK